MPEPSTLVATVRSNVTPIMSRFCARVDSQKNPKKIKASRACRLDNLFMALFCVENIEEYNPFREKFQMAILLKQSRHFLFISTRYNQTQCPTRSSSTKSI